MVIPCPSGRGDFAPEGPLTYDHLTEVFRDAETVSADWRIGAEAEKFGVDELSGAPLAYGGPRGVLRVLQRLEEHFGWRPEGESAGGPVVALRRGSASITLEPGAQLELSGSPLPDVHAIAREMREHLDELGVVSSELRLAWLAAGFHPLARQEELPWVPKSRYAVMREYLPARGSGALDMMRRTATIQANYDFANETDALDKLRVTLRVAPIVNAMTANSPLLEGAFAGFQSLRQDVWLRMDPERSGLIPKLWTDKPLGYRDYIEWALDAGMFLFKRNGQMIVNSGQTFRSFLRHGYGGHVATLEDWRFHLNTLFPEVRLKSTLEVRCCDSLPAPWMMAVPALFAGLLYDRQALEAAWELMAPVSYEQMSVRRRELATDGLNARIVGRVAYEYAEQLLDIAEGGLARRARLDAFGKDERIHLRELSRLVHSRRSPADVLVEGLDPTDSDLRAKILARTRVV